MLTNLKHFFMNDHYREMDTNSNQIVVLFRENMNTVDVLVFSDMKTGMELSKEQYSHILYQIEQSFYNKGYERVTVLSLLCTKNADRLKPYCESDRFTHWIIDMASYRLLIYENQENYYPGMSRRIEQFLTGYQQAADGQDWETSPAYKEPFNTKIKRILSMCPIVTTSIVLVNIIIFIVLEFSGLSNQIYEFGGTAYDEVVNGHEYYRLITAMFLHNGFDHLINNMFVLAVIGERLEKLLGRVKFTVVYFMTGLLSSIGSVLYYHWMGEYVISVGASGAIFGVVGGVFYLVLRYKGAKTGITSNRMALFVILSLFSGVGNSSRVDNVAHIVGFATGVMITCMIDLLRKRKKVR